MIDREDMLELTRRMTLSRNCFSRIAGAYMDREGYEDGTFNIHFLKLAPAERKKNLEIAKVIPFASANEQLKEYRFPEGQAEKKESLFQLLCGIRDSHLKDDALLDIFYELVGENYKSDADYAVYLYSGTYDIPVKASDKQWLDGSEEVYDFIICAIAPLVGEYEPGTPEFGFLFPAFADRSADCGKIDIYHRNPAEMQREMLGLLLGGKN